VRWYTAAANQNHGPAIEARANALAHLETHKHYLTQCWIEGPEKFMEIYTLLQNSLPLPIFEEVGPQVSAHWVDYKRTDPSSSPFHYAQKNGIPLTEVPLFIKEKLGHKKDEADILERLWNRRVTDFQGRVMTLDISDINMKVPLCLLWMSDKSPVELVVNQRQYNNSDFWHHHLNNVVLRIKN
jgi:hypothetical protein